MIFRQLFDATSSTYTYLLADPATRDAVIIDPVFEQHLRDVALLRELKLTLRWVLDTHVHADHVTGAWLMREALGAKIGISRASGAEGADRYFEDGDTAEFGARHLEVRSTPGHTGGSVTFVLDDRSMAFTGDALLVRGAGRTDFQSGDARALFHSITKRILVLPNDAALYPAHDYAGRTMTTVGEEREHNPRVGGAANEGDFVGYMENLGLPHPKKIDVALPANMRSGRPEDGLVPKPADWGPITRTYGGIPELDPDWVAAHLGRLQLLDVREAEELADPEHGLIEGALHVPLGELRACVGELPSARPFAIVCRSGRRSAQAALILGKAGLEAASVAGGMLRWAQAGLPIRAGAAD